jgi:hypothetical protein
VLGKILSHKPIPLTKDIEFEIVFDLLGGILAERKGLGIKHSAENGKRSEFTAFVGADIDVASVTVASGDNCSHSVKVGGATVLTKLPHLDV